MAPKLVLNNKKRPKCTITINPWRVARLRLANPPSPLGKLGDLPPELRDKIYSYITADINLTTVNFNGSDSMSSYTSWKNRDVTRSDKRRIPPPSNLLALAQTSKAIRDEMKAPICERAHTFDVDHEPMTAWSTDMILTGFPKFAHISKVDVKRITINNVRFENDKVPAEFRQYLLMAFLTWCEECFSCDRLPPVVHLFGEKQEHVMLKVRKLKLDELVDHPTIQVVWSREESGIELWSHCFPGGSARVKLP